VRTLSPKSTALIGVSELPISVPYHSVIGQLHPGPKEQGSDGVVPYWSSHLAGAQSELIVRSGHGVIDNPDAIREVIRILHLQQRSRQNRVSSCAEADSVRFSDQMICLVRFGCNFWPAAGGR
jgi:hypothetical protein